MPCETCNGPATHTRDKMPLCCECTIMYDDMKGKSIRDQHHGYCTPIRRKERVS